MSRTLRTLAFSVLIASVASYVYPARAADAAQGGVLAKRWCAECHAVSRDQQRAQSDAPSFAAISASRRVPDIAAFLGQSHPRMPDMNLSREEILDMIAYMHTLAPPVEPQPTAPAKDDYKPPARG
jgi:mono/diheme cytochrome c family protein